MAFEFSVEHTRNKRVYEGKDTVLKVTVYTSKNNRCIITEPGLQMEAIREFEKVRGNPNTFGGIVVDDFERFFLLWLYDKFAT